MQMENNVNTQIFRALLNSKNKDDALPVRPHALSFYSEISQHVSASNTIEEDYKIRIQQRITALSSATLNILMVARNVGKTSTLSALFGEHSWSETEKNQHLITRHELAQLTLWEARLPSDSADPKRMTAELGSLLAENDELGRPLIDLVLVVLDTTSNNLEDCYRDISDTLVPMLGRQTENRLMVLMNKADKVA